MNKKHFSIIVFILLSFVMFGFQNCASEIEFSSSEKLIAAGQGIPPSEPPSEEEDVVCNPFDSSEVCESYGDAGLRGSIYYLTEGHASLFSGSLYNAKLDDYKTYGNKVSVDVVMSSINISPRSWEDGFYVGSGDIVANEEGGALFEWFSLDLSGYISLPAGSYQFAQLSDDGMRVSIGPYGNSSIATVLNDDGTHAPRWKCAQSMVTFVDGEMKSIRVQYFQGPRTMISMQLFVRSAEDADMPCGEAGEFSTIDAASFSH